MTNERAVGVAAGALAVIAVLSVLSVRCSSREATRGAPDVGARVRTELAAGADELKEQRAEAAEQEIRRRRLLARKLLRDGKKAEARKAMNSIPPLEEQVRAWRGEQQEQGKDGE
jgi:hypothetical protein